MDIGQIQDVLDLQAILAASGSGYSPQLFADLIDWRDNSLGTIEAPVAPPVKSTAKRGKATESTDSDAKAFEPSPDPTDEDPGF